MSYILSELEDSLVDFVRMRIPENKWKLITTSQALLGELDEESEDELRSHFWNQLLSNVSWSRVVQDVRILVEDTIIPESDSESISSEEEEEEEEKEDASSQKSYFD